MTELNDIASPYAPRVPWLFAVVKTTFQTRIPCKPFLARPFPSTNPYASEDHGKSWSRQHKRGRGEHIAAVPKKLYNTASCVRCVSSLRKLEVLKTVRNKQKKKKLGQYKCIHVVVYMTYHRWKYQLSITKFSSLNTYWIFFFVDLFSFLKDVHLLIEDIKTKQKKFLHVCLYWDATRVWPLNALVICSQKGPPSTVGVRWRSFFPISDSEQYQLPIIIK